MQNFDPALVIYSFAVVLAARAHLPLQRLVGKTGHRLYWIGAGNCTGDEALCAAWMGSFRLHTVQAWLLFHGLDIGRVLGPRKV